MDVCLLSLLVGSNGQEVAVAMLFCIPLLIS